MYRHTYAVAHLRLAPRSLPLVVFGLIAVFLAGAVLGLGPVTRAADAPRKAVIIVGPTHDLTVSNLEAGEALAKVAESYGMDVRRVFHPRATWAKVLANIQGAHLVAYLGHGNGWPSPYGPFQEKTKNGFGLNPYEGAGKNNIEYRGANQIRANVVLASNAVVLLSHLCYASGNGEAYMAVPGWDIAHQRVDNFAAGFLAVGASSVFAYSSQPVTSVVQALFTTDKTVAEIFETSGSSATPYHGFIGWDPRKLDSDRTPGTRNYLDPHRTEGFKRSVSGQLSFTATEWRGGTTGGGETPDEDTTPTPDTTPPSQPKGLATESRGYRRIELTWQASTDDSGGAIRYRIFRDGVRIASIKTTTFVDRPASAGTYTYKVRAFDAAGNKSVFSTNVTGEAIKGPMTTD